MDEGGENINLLDAFSTFEKSKRMVRMLEQLFGQNDEDLKTVAVLALEGLFRIEDKVKSGQLPSQNIDVSNDIRHHLGIWRNNLTIPDGQRAQNDLRELTIFEKFNVPPPH